jgi:hypothetical protein
MHFLIRYLGIIVATIFCIAGLVRFRRLGKTYRPLFLMAIAGLITEILGDYVAHFRNNNAIVMNSYALLEWVLIFWQFRVWGSLRGRKEIAWLILLVPCAVWVAENLLFGNMDNFSPYFRISAGFIIVLFSVNKINFMITHDNRKLLGHPDFLICIGFIIYFIYDIVYEWAYQSSRTSATEITSTIIFLFGYINALANIIFAIAFLRIPASKEIRLW